MINFIKNWIKSTPVSELSALTVASGQINFMFSREFTSVFPDCVFLSDISKAVVGAK